MTLIQHTLIRAFINSIPNKVFHLTFMIMRKVLMKSPLEQIALETADSLVILLQGNVFFFQTHFSNLI